jgi:hypothetical protein
MPGHTPDKGHQVPYLNFSDSADDTVQRVVRKVLLMPAAVATEEREQPAADLLISGSRSIAIRVQVTKEDL